MANKKENENSYRSILRGTSMFGGVQIFQVLVNLVRGKFVALFLGPEGMGVNSLFTSTGNAISQASTLGLNLAYSKEVAAAREEPEKLAHIVSTALHAMRGAALIGALFCALFSGLISEFTFGTDAYAWQFVAMGAMVYLTVAGNGQLSLLQGLHKVRILSVSSLVGALAGLVGGVPLYYFFGTAGIVPAMIFLAFSTWLFYTIALRRVLPGKREKFSLRLHWPDIRRMLGLGLVMMATTLASTAANYLLNVFIRATGTLDSVGLFGAANSVTNQYSAVVFAAMSMDYFPRLAAIASDGGKMREVVNRQTEIVAMLIAPLALLLVVTAPLVIRILLTSRFLPALPLMRLMAVGIMLKALSFPMGYISFARSDKRLFFWLEGVFANLLFLGCGCAGFYWFGLEGLGYGMVAENAVCLAVYYVVTSRRYGYRFSREAGLCLVGAIVFTAAGFCASFFIPGAWGYVIASAILILSGAINLRKILRLLRHRDGSGDR